MEEMVMNAFKTQGPWAILFVALFFWVLKGSKEREDKLLSHNEGYQKVLGELAAGQQQIVVTITEMRNDITELQDVVLEKNK